MTKIRNEYVVSFMHAPEWTRNAGCFTGILGILLSREVAMVGPMDYDSAKASLESHQAHLSPNKSNWVKIRPYNLFEGMYN